LRYHLNQILDIPLLQKLMENFNSTSGMTASIIDADGKILLAVGCQDICVKFHRVCPQTECRCRQSDSYLKEHLHKKTYILYKCLNGLLDCAIPIIVDGHHLGTFFSGQFLSETPDEEFFRGQAQEFGFDESAYMDALRQVPIIAQDRVESIMAFHSQLVQILTTIGLQRMQQLEAVDQSEERLRESEAELRIIMKNANGIIYSLSREGKFIFVSPGWTETLGHAVGDVKGRSFECFVHPDDVNLCIKFVKKLMSTDEPQKGLEYRVKHLNGSWRWHTSSYTAVKDEAGNRLYYVGIAIDITERKQAEEALVESERRFRVTLENVKLVAAMLDNQNRITFCNDFLLQLLGWKREEVINRDWFDTFVPPDVRERDRHIIDKSLVRGIAPNFGESELLTRSGERRIILWNNTILLNPDGSSAGFAVIGEDITQRRAVEKRSHELMHELESTNSELKDFAYIVSHDLKAPLRGITSLAQWIYSDYQDKFDKDGKEQLDMLLNRTKRMHNLLDGILKYSRLNNIEEQKTEFNLNEVIMEVIELLAPPDNISILIENDMPFLRLERTRIFQLFENLISNAIKYMDKPNGEIRISCKNQDDYWQFSVSDNGPGIEEKYFDKIFTIFQTLKSRDEFESTGIGLTIVKKIVGMYGGKVWVESKIGVGSTFHFTLPSLQNDLEDE
jgi:two-component system sensor kinase FixL